PKVNGAVFTSSGLFVLVRFGASTDRGGVQGVFTCSALFSFEGSEQSECQWDGSDVVSIALPSNSRVSPGHTLHVLGGKVRAACSFDRSVCSEWEAIAGSSVVIAAPARPVSPSVSISTSDLLGSCDNMVLDISSSTGSGGRRWKSIAITVESASINVSLVKGAVSQAITPSTTRIVVPNTYLESGFTYKWSVKLCNFLLACNSKSKTVGVSNSIIPVVRILGQAIRTVKRRDTLRLSADAYVTLCNQERSSSSLSYTWRIYDPSGAALTSLNSAAADPRVFRLPPFTLSSQSTYLIETTVANVISGLTAVASASVYVSRGNIVAVISGGSEQNLPWGEVIVLDGSNSYDEDVSSAQGQGLHYEWTCVRKEPTFSASQCGVNVISSPLAAKIYVNASSGVSQSSLSELTLTVAGSSGRISTASVSVRVKAPEFPFVRITSSSMVLNPSGKLSISGVVSSSEAAVVQWSVDEPTVDLLVSARTDTMLEFAAGSLLSPTTINLVLGPDSLYARGSFSFVLSCTTDSGHVSSSALTVSTNGAPVPGLILAHPSEGQSMLTEFTISADQWYDEEFPLLYEFGYSVSAVDDVAYLSFRAKAELTYAATLLPVGLSGNDNVVFVRVQVFDFLQASSSLTTNVTV
ncbi:unnamed protein product, partial [Ectocarpus fasciculatus]